MTRIPFPLITALLVAILCGAPGVSLEARGQGQVAPVAIPSAATKYYESGLAHAKKGEDDQALADFRRAIELDPNRFEPYLSLDDLLSKKGDWDTIIASWTRFLAVQPNNARAHRERGGTFTHTKDYARALQDYKEACRLGDQFGCQLADRCAQVLAARNRPAPTPPRREDKGLFGALAVLVILAAVPVLIIVWLVSYFRSRSRAVRLPRGVSGPQPQVVAAQWQLPSELSSPGPRFVQTKSRVVLTWAIIPVILVFGYWILLANTKPMRILAAELAQRHFDTQGVVTLLVVVLLLSYPFTFVLRAILILLKSRTLLRDGQAAGGTVTRIARSRWGLSIYYKFSTDAGMLVEGKCRVLSAGPSRVLRVGQSVTVLYDRQNPQQSTLYPTEAYDLAA